MDLRTRTLEWVSFVPEFCPPPADHDAQMAVIKKAFKFFWKNVVDVSSCVVGRTVLGFVVHVLSSVKEAAAAWARGGG